MPALYFIAVVLTLTACRTSPTPRLGEPDYWPTQGWRSASPESQGLDSEVLAAMIAELAAGDYGIHSLLVVRRGYVVLDATFYPYDGQTPHDVASVTKSVTSTLLGAAIHAGVLDTIDRGVVAAVGRDPASLDDRRKRAITLADVAAMRAGLDCGLASGEPELIAMQSSSDWIDYTLGLPLIHAPGERFAYCSPGTHLLSVAITRLTGAAAGDFAQRTLFDPLGITPGGWPADPAGHNHGWGDLRLHPHDMAKLGFLILHDGRWDNERVFPAGWVTRIRRSRGATGAGDDGYGLGWWLPGGELDGALEGRGRGGQRIVIVPDRALVVVTTGAGFEPRVVAPFLMAAMKNDTALPVNDAAHDALGDALDRARSGPVTHTITPPPRSATLASRNVYAFAPNPLGLSTLAFDFSVPERPRLALALSGTLAPSAAGRFDLPIGVDGRFRMGRGPRGHRVGLRGAWTGEDALTLDYVEPAGADAFALLVDFEGEHLQVRVTDKTGLLGEHDLVGRLQMR